MMWIFGFSRLVVAFLHELSGVEDAGGLVNALLGALEAHDFKRIKGHSREDLTGSTLVLAEYALQCPWHLTFMIHLSIPSAAAVHMMHDSCLPPHKQPDKLAHRYLHCPEGIRLAVECRVTTARLFSMHAWLLALAVNAGHLAGPATRSVPCRSLFRCRFVVYTRHLSLAVLAAQCNGNWQKIMQPYEPSRSRSMVPVAIKAVMKYAIVTGNMAGFSTVNVRSLRPDVVRILVETLCAPYRATMPAWDLVLTLYLISGLKDFPTSCRLTLLTPVRCSSQKTPSRYASVHSDAHWRLSAAPVHLVYHAPVKISHCAGSIGWWHNCTTLPVFGAFFETTEARAG